MRIWLLIVLAGVLLGAGCAREPESETQELRMQRERMVRFVPMVKGRDDWCRSVSLAVAVAGGQGGDEDEC